MPRSELMPIGVFARRSGLTASALRFYADSGLLRPAEVDPVSGYRYYDAGQLPRASTLRRLREMAMPLTTAEAVLDAEPAVASRLIDEHVARVRGDAAATEQAAAVLKASLAGTPSLPIATLKGPILADAVEQVLSATVREAELPVLDGLHLDVRPEAITLAATDRYRLSVRTLVPVEPPTTTWAGTVQGDEMRIGLPEIRRTPVVRIEATQDELWFRGSDREDPRCRLLPEEFPDYRLMLDSLGPVTTRVTVAKEPLLRALRNHPGERIALVAAYQGLEVASAGGDRLPATVTGEPLRLSFALTTLYPAISGAIGSDVMLDLRGPDQPVTIRSADHGDLTTVAMPIKPDRST